MLRVFIRGSKGNKDRYTILSRQCLDFLRDYECKFRPNHLEGLLFPGCKNISCITDKAVNEALKKWLTVAGSSQNVSIHSLRHGFAAHLLEFQENPPRYPFCCPQHAEQTDFVQTVDEYTPAYALAAG